MSSEEASAWLRRQRAERDARVEEAKRQALSEAKEPFDLDHFEAIYSDPNEAGSTHRLSREERIYAREIEYYIGRGRRAKTLQEFADTMRYYDDHDWT